MQYTFAVGTYFRVSDSQFAHGRRKRGTGGRVPRSRKISGGRPPEIMILQYLF